MQTFCALFDRELKMEGRVAVRAFSITVFVGRLSGVLQRMLQGGESGEDGVDSQEEAGAPAISVHKSKKYYINK